MSRAERARLRRTLMSSPTLREASAAVVEAMLLALDGVDDDEIVDALAIFVAVGELDDVPAQDRDDAKLPAGVLRRRLRDTLAELAAHTSR